MSAAGEGFGSVTLWGFSPALDLQEDILPQSLSKSDDGPGGELDVCNILVVGAGDCRHILKTIAYQKRHKKKKIHIYVIENNLELLARHLLFTTLALEPAHRMGLQEKVELFSELYGNTLIRQQTLQYLQQKANLFIEMITDLDYCDERMPTIDMSQLKFKERDYLEDVFKFWRHPDPRAFNITALWNHRLRTYLNLRYDSRKGAYDWDLSMRLHALGATMITNREYVRWRESGVAFEAREGVYDRVNKSFASGVVLKRTSEEITFHNLTSLFHELQTGNKYEPGRTSDRITELTEPSNTDVDMETAENCRTSAEEDEGGSSSECGHRESYAPISCENVVVHFLPLNSISELPKKNKFKKLFNHAFFSASMVLNLQPALKDIFADHASLSLELVRYILDLNKHQIDGFTQHVSNLATGAGFEPCRITNNEAYARFRFKSPPVTSQ